MAKKARARKATGKERAATKGRPARSKGTSAAAARAARELKAALAAERWHKDVKAVRDDARALLKELRKGGSKLPVGQRKALGAVAKELRKAGREMKKLVSAKAVKS